MGKTDTTIGHGAAAPGPAHRPGPRAAVVLGLGLLPLVVGLSRHVGLSDLLGPAGGATVLVVLVLPTTWGALSGLLALAVQRLRGVRR